MRPRVDLLVAGSCTHPEHVVLRTGRLRPLTFPSMFALLVHPTEGVVLYDTGYSERFLELTSRMPEKLYAWVTPVTLAPEHLARTRLAARGIAPNDVRTIVLSHFHADHMAALCDFPKARIVYHPDAWASVRDRRGISALRKAFLPGLLPTDFEVRAAPLATRDFRPLPPDLAALGSLGVDLFGDGSAFAVPLPGHAAGQVGLVVRDDRDRLLFLVADAAWTLSAITQRRLPHPVTRLLFADWRAYADTLRHLADVAEARPDVHLVPSHCADTLARLA